MPDWFVDVNAGPVDVWTPLDLASAAQETRGNHFLSVVARLRSDVSTATAQRELDIMSAAQAEEFGPHEGWSAKLVPLHEDVVGNARETLYMLLGAAALVLLLACLNVANLFVARNVARERELATRAALGSGRSRLARQLLSETMLIAGIGGVVGVLVAYEAIPALLALTPEPVPRAESIAPDVRMLVFAVGLTLATGVIAGLAPVLRFIRPDLEPLLRSGSRSATGGVRVARIRSALIVTQVTLGVVLCIGAALLMRSFFNLQRVELGFASQRVTTLEVHLPLARYDAGRRIDFHQSLHDRIEAVPGIDAAGAVSWLPVSGEYNSWGYRLEGREDWVGANFRVIEGNYFEALRIPLVRGRVFDRSDEADSPLVAIVNESLVARDFPDRDAVGQVLLVEGNRVEIVGVVRDVAHDHRGTVGPKVYLPHTQIGHDRNWALTQVISASRPWRDVVAQVRRELQAIDPALTMHNVQTMRHVMAGEIARETFTLVLLGVFGTIAVVLVTVGIYGVLTYAVNERTQEIGIRLALGANTVALRNAVVLQGVRLTIAGVLLGLIGAIALTRVLRSMLFDVGTMDPLVLTATPLAMVVVAVLAASLPAHRATRVDPMEALRQE
jgi:predicted permease